MTTAADDSAVEDAFEAYLAGRPVPEEAAGTFHGVAVFAEAVRATAAQPGRPNAALAELLATGLLADQSSPSARTAISAGAPPSRRASRVRRRRRFAMFFPALLAKLLSAGALAQAATGAGIVVVAVTGAGVAGVLPGPVQETFTSVVGSETSEVTTPPTDPTAGTEAPVTETVEPPAIEDPAAATPEEVAATGFTFEEWQQGPAADQSFGEWVSSGARLGYVDGRIISEWAHKRHEDRWGGTTTAPATAEPTDEVEVEVEHADAEGERGHRGNSSGHGDGEDRSGHGGNGRD